MKDDQHVEQYQYKEGSARVAGETVERLDPALSAAVARFIRRLEDIESQYSLSQTNADLLTAATTVAMTEMHRACEEFEQRVGHDAMVIRHAQAAFREKTRRVFSASHFISYARIWPRGFPGDYKILEYAYQNTARSEGIGRFLDEYCLATTLSRAVRERKEALKDILKIELKQRKKAAILDVACGSCREIFELSAEITQAEAKVICIDFDVEALTFASNLLSGAGLVPDLVEFRKYNALKMVSHERNVKEFGMRDVIYSVGLFDYLQDDVLIRLLASLYELLNPQGRLIASFKDSRTYRTQFYHWTVDWSAFYQRTEEDCRRLFEQAGIPRHAIQFRRDRSGVIMFFIATK
jgi:extracellular factor (EF) 3-hydroxypalmitic acid methyl ester biosynthesis protein